jgi:DNA polymerase-3 subunit beta
MATSTTTRPGGLSATCPRKDLFEGVNIVGKAVATRSPVPILTHVMLSHDADSGRLKLTATDLELWIEHTMPMAQEGLSSLVGSGSATVPAKNLGDLLAAMPEMPVELTSEGGEGVGFAIHLRCNRANYKLLGLAPEDFPLLPQVKQDTQFKISRQNLREAVRQTIFAVSPDENRAILTGILMIYKDERLLLVATDTHRLAVRESPTRDGAGANAQVVVPANAMHEVLRILGAGDESGGDVVVTFSNNQVQFRIEDEKTGTGTTVISRLIEGQFPSYERVVPQSHEHTLTLERDPFFNALRRASIVARGEGAANRVVLRTLDLDESAHVTLTAESGNLGNAFEELEVIREGSDVPIEIAFNVKYLLDVLSVLDTEGVRLELTEPLRPGVVRAAGDGTYFCLLMPMQVPDR